MLLISILLLFQSVENLLDRGFDQYEAGKYEEAIKIFNKAVEIDPLHAESYYLRGLSYHGLDFTKLAVDDLKKAINLRPSYAEAYQQLGFIYLVGQAPELAIEAFSNALELAPLVAELYLNRGTAYCMLGDLAKSKKDWNQARAMGIDFDELMTCE
ncbi:MAG: tetratricopeptide repeat protein [Flammeovirgaceae bacterium]|jgi:tetratricopeptide (TPR) repeat protein|nr:tetratricopeptide repeat protein [Flammeovirgaceae bacterium]|tara:strand:+ start:1130 stop:1597 length:468 start_codon:yes stop_codon:yes gene_type:complete